MSVRFHYLPRPTHAPVVSLGGRAERPRPLIAVTVLGPALSVSLDALLDTGADDTVFPDRIATSVGVDLRNAPVGASAGVGSGTISVRYAEVMLRIADNQERREWQAWVGFTAAPLRQPLLGFAGFLQYFTAAFHGDREEVELTVNGLYAGT